MHTFKTVTVVHDTPHGEETDVHQVLVRNQEPNPPHADQPIPAQLAIRAVDGGDRVVEYDMAKVKSVTVGDPV